MSGPAGTIAGPHPAGLSGEALRRVSRVEFGRASGPGGQHRNKVDTAVRMTHLPSGITTVATRRRSQSQNRHAAERQLRLKLAVELRAAADPRRYRPSALWQRRRQGEKLPVNPRHRDYPALLAEALDVVSACGFDVGAAAGVLGVTMSQLARLLRHERGAFERVNDNRRARGLPALK